MTAPHPHARGLGRRTAALAALAGTALASTLAGTALVGSAQYAAGTPEDPPARSAGSSPDAGFGKTDREFLARAERNGEERVTVLVAAEEGETDAAISEIRALGGRVEARDARVGYVKASVPTGRAERVPDLGSVKAVDVDGLIRLDDPRPRGEGQEAPQPQQAPDRSTPRVNPYMPTTDTGAAEFAPAENDGTGVTVAVLDSGVDLDHPALRRLPDGSRKVVDWFNANSPSSGDGTWVRMAGSHTGTFTANGRTWTAPASGGPYSFGILNEGAQDLGAAGSEFGADLDRDGVLRESFGVLQDISTKEVVVDLDNDGSFTDQPRMTDYANQKQVGYFGRDRAATRVVERVAFVVQTNLSNYGEGQTPWVNIGVSGAHGTHVAGIAAGHSLFGGDVDGAAPGAEVMSIRACLASTACTSSGLIDGVLYGARNGADVMNISIGGLPALNDGNNARSELYNRTIDEFDMQIFISAGNSGTGANTVGDPSVSTDAMSVGSSITDETWLSNYGSPTDIGDGLHPFSSRGPREDGGFKPQITAPGSAISSTPRWQAPGPVAGTYSLPAGYSMFNGTSMASPQATGAAALLIGAYQEANDGERPPVEELRTAMMSGATSVPGLGAYEQGSGLVDVAAAWALLSEGVDSDTVTTSVPVSTVLSDQLATPGVGVGIHDREGVTSSYEREYTLTRTSGPDGTRTYEVTWVGDDGTFTSADSVDLPLGEPVTFPVAVTPAGPGAHSAVMRLDDPDTVGIDAQTMNAVFAPEELTAETGFTASVQGTLGRNETESMFVEVPEGATALQIDLAGGGSDAGAGQLRFLRFSPFGVPEDTTSSLNCYNPPVNPGGSCTAGSPTSRTVLNPTPGVWEIVVDARRTSDSDAAPYEVTAKVLGAAVSPDPDVIDSATIGAPVSRSYTVTNSFAEFTGRLTGGPLASADIRRPTIANLAQQRYDLTVPAGATAVSAQIGNPADAGADLDLLLFNCTSGTCVLAASSAGGTSEERVSVANPAAGRWQVLVDGFAVPAGTTAYDYRDVISSPAFGSVAVTDANAPRPSGSSWTVPGTVTAAAQPGQGRQLLGTLGVVDDAGRRLATSEVIVREVTAAR